MNLFYYQTKLYIFKINLHNYISIGSFNNSYKSYCIFLLVFSNFFFFTFFCSCFSFFWWLFLLFQMFCWINNLSNIPSKLFVFICHSFINFVLFHPWFYHWCFSSSYECFWFYYFFYCSLQSTLLLINSISTPVFAFHSALDIFIQYPLIIKIFRKSTWTAPLGDIH